MFKKFVFTLLYGGLLGAQKVLAVEVCPPGQICNPIEAKSFAEIVDSVADLIIQIGTPLATVFLIYSGLLFVSARGNEKQLESAKETFKWTVIGTALIIGGAAIASAVIDFATKL